MSDKKPESCCKLPLQYSEIGNDDYKGIRAICGTCSSIYEIKDKIGLVYFQKTVVGLSFILVVVMKLW